ncbi:MAG: hypothetical protein ABJE95_23840 [Byssovorax sp.]
MSQGRAGATRSVGVLSLLLALGACGELDPLALPREATPPVACAAWTSADASGVCRPRAWVLPGDEEGMGPAGARAASAALDGRGRALLGWQIDAPGVSGIVVAEERSAGVFSLRSPTIHVVTDPIVANAGQTRVAAGASGEAVVTWSQGGANSAGYIFASARDAAGHWSDPAAAEDSLSFQPRAFQPFVTTSPRGEWILAWNQWYDVHFGVALAHRRPGESAWTRPKQGDDVLSVPIFYSNAPQVALDSRGAGLIVWFQSTGGPLMVYASERATGDGEFSHPAKDDFLSAAGAPVDSHPIANPRPALSEQGEAAVVWTQEDGTGALPVFLATRGKDGVWTKPRGLGDSFSPAVGAARCAQAAFGPDGALTVLWYQDQGEGDAVFAARRDASGQWIDDGKHPRRLSASDATAYAPALAVGPGGGVLAVFVEEAKGKARIVARRTGSALPWSDEEPLSPAGQAVSDPAAALGPADRAVVAWAQGPFGQQRIVTARVE